MYINDDWFDLEVDPSYPKCGIHADVQVLDQKYESVARVRVFDNGYAELMWQAGWEPYAYRDRQWWNALADEVAKAVAA